MGSSDIRLSVSFLINSSPASIITPSSASLETSGKRKASATTEHTSRNINRGSLLPQSKKLKCETGEPSQRCALVPLQEHHTELVLRLWHKQREAQRIQYLHKKKLEEDIAKAKQTKLGPQTIPNTHEVNEDTIPCPPRIDSPQGLVSLVNEWIRETSMIEFPLVIDKRRRKISVEQAHVLEKFFALAPFPTLEAKICVANCLGISERSIAVWFQNKRARIKKLERNYPKRRKAREEMTFHNLTVGDDGKLEVMPHFCM